MRADWPSYSRPQDVGAIQLEDAAKGECDDIGGLTHLNNDFRHVLYTGKNLPLVLMSLKPGQDIGENTHATHGPFFRVENGKGDIEIDGVTQSVKSGSGIVVSAGARHNLKNTGDLINKRAKPLKIHKFYGPPDQVDQLQ